MFWPYNYGKSALDDYSGFWRSDHCSGHLHQRVKNIMFDHIQYIGLFALKINVRTSVFCFNKIQI